MSAEPPVLPPVAPAVDAAVSPPVASRAIERFASVTPAGCYYAIESARPTPERRRLIELLQSPETQMARALDAATDETASLAVLIEAGFVVLVDESEQLPEGPLSDHMPILLPALSERGRAVLTESRQGLFLDYVGVAIDEAEELAVLASRLRATADRANTLLADRLGIDSRSFGIIDPAGNSEIGFWPLHIGQNVFTLTIIGIPRFNSPEFRRLVWVLSERYGQTLPEHDDGKPSMPPA